MKREQTPQPPAGLRGSKVAIGWRLFRGARIGVLLLLLAVVAAGTYLNQVGLPDFLKQRLLDELRNRGVELQFSRLRLRWYRGIVAEDVRFGRAAQPTGPQLSIDEAELRLNHAALKKLAFMVDGLVLHRGQFVWPLLTTNQPAKHLTVEVIETELRFLPNDRWELDHFQARFAGVKVQLAGAISNASAVREWKIFHPAPQAEASLVQQRLRQFVETVETIKFATLPELKLTLHGDARDFQSFNGTLRLHVSETDTPWGAGTNVLLSARLGTSDAPSRRPELQMNLTADTARTPWATTTNLHLALRLISADSWPELQIRLEAAAAKLPWATTTNLHLALNLVAHENQTNLANGDLEINAGQVETQWGQSSTARFTAHWLQFVTNATPIAGKGELQLANAQSKWGNANSMQLALSLLSPATNQPPRANKSWAWWSRLEPYWLDWQCRLVQIQWTEFDAAELLCAGQWRAPELSITNLHAKLYQGKLDVRAALNVATREVSFHVATDFDAHQITPLLTEKAQNWFRQFAWETPPRLEAQGGVVLPEWTNRQPDWRAEVLPTLRLQGEFQSGPGAFLGVPVTSAQSHFTYSNMFWRLPDLHLTRPEGQLDLAHQADDRSRDFYWRVRGTVDVRAVRPLLEPAQQPGLDDFVFTDPPSIDGEVWGCWRAQERTFIKGQATLSNFTFRGESVSRFHTMLEYTNQILTLFSAEALRPDQRAAVDRVGVDFAAKKICLTNGFSTMEPMVVARAIGPKTARAIEPYQFSQPPTVRVSGVVPLEGTKDTNLRFEVDGGPFQWWKFGVPHISGQVLWMGEQMTVTNIEAAFYGGRVNGAAEFDFRPENGANFHFGATATNVNLQLFMRDVYTSTNQLEGLLSGQLSIDSANSANWQSWQGRGGANLCDGMLWEVPIFGIFSPVLDGIVPGLGKTRFSDGSASFVITNSVIRSEDLQIRAPMLRMQYRGAVEFQGRVNARVEAELLRDTWFIGPVVSLALWPVSKLFEYHVSGSLWEPKSKPVYYVPKLLLMPLHPLRTLKELLPTDSTPTNVPPPAKAP